MPPHLYAAGSNGSSQLSLHHTEDVSKFTLCQFDPTLQDILPDHTQILDLVSASTHSLLLVKSPNHPTNLLLSAGTNSVGQFGPKCQLWSDVRSVTRWKLLDLLDDVGLKRDEWEVVKVGCTWTTSILVYRRILLAEEQVGGGTNKAGSRIGGGDEEEEGEQVIVTSGSNDFGELGTVEDVGGINLIRLEQGETVEMLRGGQRHVLAVVRGKKGQKVFGWGAGRHDQLDPSIISGSNVDGSKAVGKGKGKGKASALPIAVPFTLLEGVIPPGRAVLDIALGASHSLVLFDDGSVKGWGRDDKGQISDLDDLKDVVGIATTWGGSYFLNGKGEIWSQGRNTYSQLVRSDSPGCRGIVQIPRGWRAKQIVTGSEHLLVIAERESDDGEKEDELWVGGWNEHGNLGLGDRKDRGELARVSLERKGKGVLGIWGGCGGSWVWLGAEAASR